MLMELQSSIHLHITNFSLKFRWRLAYRSRPLDPLETRPRPLIATSILMKIFQSLRLILDPPVPTSGTLSITPCHMASPHLHILPYQCNPRGPCRTYVVAPTVLFSLILVRDSSLRQRDKTSLIRRLDRAPSHPIIFATQTMASVSSSSIKPPMASWLEWERD